MQNASLAVIFVLAIGLLSSCTAKPDSPTEPSAVPQTQVEFKQFASERYEVPADFATLQVSNGNFYASDNAALTDAALFYSDGNKLRSLEKSDSGEILLFGISSYEPLVGFDLVQLGNAFGAGFLALESDGHSWVVRHFDNFGSFESELDISSGFALYSEAKIYKFYADRDGALYFLLERGGELSVIVLQENSAQLLNAPGRILNCVLSGDGTPFALVSEPNGNALYPIKSDFTLGAKLCDVTAETHIYNGGGKIGLITNDYNMLHTIDTSTGETIELLDMREVGITDMYVLNVWCDSQNRLVIRLCLKAEKSRKY